MLIGFQMKSYFKLMEEMFIKDRIMRDVVIEYYEDAKSFVGAYGKLKIFFMKKIRTIQRFDIKVDTVVKGILLEGIARRLCKGAFVWREEDIRIC